MSHATCRLAAVALAAFAPAVLAAQATAPAPTYNILTVFRETVKAGKSVEHNAHEVAWARASAAAKAPTMLAASSMSGNNEIWYMSAYPSWEDYEKSNKAAGANAALQKVNDDFSSKEDDYLSDGRPMVLRFRGELSYGPPANLATSRYFTITRVAVRPGHTDEYEEVRKLIRAAHESARLSDGFSVWQVTAGAPAGTYFTIVARRSLAELDSATAIHGAAYQAALGGAEGQKRMSASAAAAIINSETNHFAFAPGQSIPPAEWIAADPKYWTRPAPKKAP